MCGIRMRRKFELVELDEKLSPITKTRPFKYIENFTTKNWKFSDKNSDIFFFIFLLRTYIVGTR